MATLTELIKEIQSAEVEAQVREKQLAELRPKRQQLEQDCKDQFECSIADLPKLIEEKEQELSDGIASLSEDIEKAKNS